MLVLLFLWAVVGVGKGDLRWSYSIIAQISMLFYREINAEIYDIKVHYLLQLYSHPCAISLH